MILCGKISYQLSEHALEESLMRLFCFLAMHFRLRCEIFSPRQSLRRFTGTLTQQETTLSMGGRPCLQQTGLPGVRQASCLIHTVCAVTEVPISQERLLMSQAVSLQYIVIRSILHFITTSFFVAVNS